MINIKLYEEWCAELVARVNKKCEFSISRCQFAVSEAHMVKKMANAQGIALCVSYPDTRGVGSDTVADVQQGFFFVVERVAQGMDSDKAEVDRYERLQTVMLALRDEILESQMDCMQLMPTYDYKIEWEWQIFGGCNGLSLGIKFKNND